MKAKKYQEGLLDRGLRLAHFAGLILFLGSIFSFIVVSTLVKHAGIEGLALGRQVIGTGTGVLTVPGVWVIALSGLWMGLRKYGLHTRFFQIKMVLGVLILANAHLFVVPAVQQATELAAASLTEGRLRPEYFQAFDKEELFGIFNVAMAVAAMIVAVWKIGFIKKVETEESV